APLNRFPHAAVPRLGADRGRYGPGGARGALRPALRGDGRPSEAKAEAAQTTRAAPVGRVEPAPARSAQDVRALRARPRLSHRRGASDGGAPGGWARAPDRRQRAPKLEAAPGERAGRGSGQRSIGDAPGRCGDDSGARDGAPLDSAMDLTLVSYNVHSGIGTDGRFDLERIALVLKRS